MKDDKNINHKRDYKQDNEFFIFINLFDKKELNKLKKLHNHAINKKKENYSYKDKLFTIQEGNMLIKFIEKETSQHGIKKEKT